ncbi:uncharacterized protein LOC114308591 [Camellia sinensis]|uniref:uncharacterized protein LOC114308591 n=1 Tax=Camellia sinensis TaxID=4442 RepID=UPI001035CC4B|nr:uncharacterized protein LOC114308591 [Camellia sinensis]
MSGRGSGGRGRPRKGRRASPAPQDHPPQEEGVGQNNAAVPPAQDAIGALAREMAGAFPESMEILRAEQAARTIEEETQVSFLKKEFFRSNPTEYSGEPNLMKVDEWLEQIVKSFQILDINDGELRVALVAYQLKGEADQWKKLRKQFEELRQLDTPVAEFEAMFTNLARFAPELVATEERQCFEFEKRLRPKILMKVMGHVYQEYDKLVEAAAHVEIMMEAEEAKQKHKRPNYVDSKGNSGSSKKSKSSFSSSSQSMPQPTKSSGSVSMRSLGNTGPNLVTCFRYGQQGHKASDCNRNLSHQQQAQSQSPAQGRGQSPACYYCGQLGHIKRSCPDWKGEHFEVPKFRRLSVKPRSETRVSASSVKADILSSTRDHIRTVNTTNQYGKR